MSYLEWMHGAWQAVTQRALESEDETWTELDVKERWLSSSEIHAYYEKRMTRYRSLWLEQVLLFLTTMMRCLPPPEAWSPQLAADLVEFLTCIHTLLSNSTPCPFNTTLQANTIVWSTLWQKWMSTQLDGSEKEANQIFQTSILCLPLSQVPVAGAVSFIQPQT
jgi:hypothetical protein